MIVANASWWNITDDLFCSVTFTTLYILWSFKSYFQFLDFMFYNLVSLRILSVVGFLIHYSFYFKLSNFWSLLPHFLMTVFLLCLATASELRICILWFTWLLVFSPLPLATFTWLVTLPLPATEAQILVFPKPQCLYSLLFTQTLVQCWWPKSFCKPSFMVELHPNSVFTWWAPSVLNHTSGPPWICKSYTSSHLQEPFSDSKAQKIHCFSPNLLLVPKVTYIIFKYDDMILTF